MTDEIYCTCGNYLGRVDTVTWYHERRGKEIETKFFRRIVGGFVVAKIYVRGELVCERCKREQIWEA